VSFFPTAASGVVDDAGDFKVFLTNVTGENDSTESRQDASAKNVYFMTVNNKMIINGCGCIWG
jgi:hypothetical protein